MKITETIRKDGLRIISCYIPHRKTVEVELMARVGSAYDPANKPGLYHCLEHMAFKGTRKRNLKNLHAFSDKNLINHHALTYKLSTMYQAEATYTKLPFACEYLCDIYLNSTFPKIELEREKKTILLEDARKKCADNDDDESFADRTLWEHLYKEYPAYLYDGGTAKGLRNIKRSDLVNQRGKWHIPSNTIAIATGNVDHQEFVNEINKRIPHNPKKVLLKKWSDQWQEPLLKKEVVVIRPRSRREIIVIGCKMPVYSNEKTAEALSLYYQMVGGKKYSVLWNEIREKRGLAYVVDCGFQKITGLGGVFSVYLEIDQSKHEKVMKLLWQSLLRPLTNTSEFNDYKKKLASEINISKIHQDSDYKSKIEDYIEEGKSVKSIEREDYKRLNIIKSITLKDINEICKKFIQPDRFFTLILKPRQPMAELDERLAALSKHIGRSITEGEQGAVLDIVDEITPQDENGYYAGPLISFEKAWEIYELRSQVKKLIKNR